MAKPKTLQQAIKYFSDEQVCIDTVAELRWPNGPVCPKCEHREHYYLATQKRWKCKKCGKQFSVKVGTIFEDSPISLDKWLIALWLLVNCKNGISSYEVGRDLGISQKSAWHVLHRLRKALQNGSFAKLAGEIEVDETYIGGKARNMHLSRKLKKAQVKKGRVSYGKVGVQGILSRGGEVRAMVIQDSQNMTLQRNISKHVHRDVP